jgi:hypothetical protein
MSRAIIVDMAIPYIHVTVRLRALKRTSLFPELTYLKHTPCCEHQINQVENGI